MGVRLSFAIYPISATSLSEGIENVDAITQLASLCATTVEALIAGDLRVQIPDEQRLDTLNIASIELRNTLNRNAGQTIYIFPPDTSGNAPTSLLLTIE
jgi:hypothetical protein